MLRYFSLALTNLPRHASRRTIPSWCVYIALPLQLVYEIYNQASQCTLHTKLTTRNCSLKEILQRGGGQSYIIPQSHPSVIPQLLFLATTVSRIYRRPRFPSLRVNYLSSGCSGPRIKSFLAAWLLARAPARHRPDLGGRGAPRNVWS